MEDEHSGRVWVWDAEEIFEEHLEEMNNEELWKKNIKDRCFVCKAKIPGMWAYYRKLGNCCSPCNGRIEMVVKQHLDKEIADELFKERLAQVARGEKVLQFDYVLRKLVYDY